MTKNAMARLCLLAALGIARPAGLRAQQDTPPPAKPAETEEVTLPRKPPEGSVIINLPSADTPGPHILQLLFTHRFSEPVQGSDIHNLFSFDSGADVNIGLSYTPIKNLEVGFYRARTFEDYEFSGKYTLLGGPSPLNLGVRVGGDWRTERNYPEPWSFFVQGIAAVTIAERVRITLVPTYVTKAVPQQELQPIPIHNNVFNVPIAVSASLTRSVNLQGEVVPGTHGSATGWIVAIEKTLPKHRFSFTAGNQREVTVDQYIASDFRGLPHSNIYLGFNIVRQWKM